MNATRTTSTTGTHPDLQQLYDRTEITDLIDRLALHLDEGRFDEVRELVVEDATVRTPGGESHGREALVAQARRNHPTDQRFQHVVTNILIDLDGDRAEARANLVLHVTTPDDAPAGTPAPSPLYALGEVYRFELARTPEGWRFSRIETSLVWASGTPPTPPAPTPTPPTPTEL